jgi:hypothetical protein
MEDRSKSLMPSATHPSDDAKWHWGEGNKYAIEGVKSMLILNGAASVSVLTFIGSMKPKLHPGYLIFSMVSFALGALFAVLIFVSAYLTQLFYGNDRWSLARKLHISTYLVLILSVASFVGGIGLAAKGFFQLP